MNRVWRDLLILVSAFGAIWIGVTLIPFGSFESDDSIKGEGFISIENEVKLGRLFVDELILNDPSVKIVTSQKFDSTIHHIASRLIESVDSPLYDFKFRIIESNQINAFTLPGGNIFIYTGLIEFAESPEEVAAVLAHEIGHAQHRHVVSRIVKELGITILFTILSGGDQTIIKELYQMMVSTYFDREQEVESDDFALELMKNCKIHPIALSTFFRRLSEKYDAFGGHLNMFNTHPASGDRAKDAMEFAASHPMDDEEKFINIGWEEMMASFDSVNE